MTIFGAGLGSFDELSGGILAILGAGLGSFDELPGRFLVAIGERPRSFHELTANNWYNSACKKARKEIYECIECIRIGECVVS